MEKFLEKSFIFRLILYLILYNLHISIIEVELTTILVSLFLFSYIFSFSFWNLRKIFLILFLLILSISLESIQLFPHMVFGYEIGYRFCKLSPKRKQIFSSITVYLLLISNIYLVISNHSKYESYLGFEQLTVYSHISVLLIFVSTNYNSFSKKYFYTLILLFLSSLFIGIRTFPYY